LKRKLFTLNVVARLTLRSSGSCQKQCEETGVSKVVVSETEEEAPSKLSKYLMERRFR
jgi:hypothetical protein